MRTFACLVLILAIGAGGCTDAHDAGDDAAPIARADVGTDAQTTDAGLDAQERDAPPSIDAAPPDAFDPPDGSRWDPEWRPLVDAPSDCHVEIATHPDRLSWSNGYVFSAHRIEGHTYFDVAPPQGGPHDRWTSYRGLADASAAVVTALRWYADPVTGGNCWIEGLDTYATDVGLLVGFCGVGSTCGIWGNWVSRVYRGRYDDLATSQRKIGEFDIISLISDEPPEPNIALGATHTSVDDLQAAVRVVLADGSTSVIGGAAFATWPALARVMHVGNDMLFVSSAGPTLMRSVDGAVATPLHDALDRPIAWLGTDGTTFAWTVGDTDLYAGTYDGALHGTLVRAGPHAAGAAVGGGCVARFEPTTTAPVHTVMTLDRVADGLRATVDLPEYGIGYYPPRVLWIASDEILLAAPSGYDVLAEIRRIDPRTLTFR